MAQGSLHVGARQLWERPEDVIFVPAGVCQRCELADWHTRTDDDRLAALDASNAADLPGLSCRGIGQTLLKVEPQIAQRQAERLDDGTDFTTVG